MIKPLAQAETLAETPAVDEVDGEHRVLLGFSSRIPDLNGMSL